MAVEVLQMSDDLTFGKIVPKLLHFEQRAQQEGRPPGKEESEWYSCVWCQPSARRQALLH